MFRDLARMMDVSAVRTHHGRREIDQLIEAARRFRFANVHVLPAWMSYIARELADLPDVLPAGPVGFPSGGHSIGVKCAEAESLLWDGAEEIDLVLNIGMLRGREYKYVAREVQQIRAICRQRILKVIIEINVLNDEEVIRACDLVVENGADFVKTGTGWIPGGANIERIRKIIDHVSGSIKVKAAGGIKTLEEVMILRDLGVDRFGINADSAVGILEGTTLVEAQ